MQRQAKSKIPVLLYQYEGPERNIGFTLSPLYLNEEMHEIRQEDRLFIYDEDFKHIRPAIHRVFPLTDPQSGEELQAFDPCWDNPMVKEVWPGILAELDQVEVVEPELRVFLDSLTTWIRNVLASADGIEVTGNL
ncbi:MULTISPECIES: hypothetical protein [Paenibacillus]|uniref:Uncharacterized protein n=1 Tax=Paenibacillus cucumis (ex Kampfer et al. 2016) TaxID=1776858 RepID=A0ABS7KNU2_9BACL|nr:hypothetical protein [Paenibacillus cucumis (ex Kampfer et al. 2016)]MBY0205834.1 hypothetical protein [Paenibacillus cucumis (ex Kampfer et al. 2016)]